MQLLFADASTGAHSPALVRQGQIGEIIAAKPQARRLILEEAAGISGLHSRRHEAELRLKGAEDNLLRVEDVLKQIDVQVESLKRQARQSSRYRNIAADIRRHNALAHLIAWREHETAFAEAAKKLDSDLLDVAERTRAQGEAARLQALAAADLPSLREEEARRGAALHRMTLARDALEAEEKRASEREAELERRAAQFTRDLEREQALIADAASMVERLAAEDLSLADALDNAGGLAAEARDREEEAHRRLSSAEADLAEAQTASSDLNARRHALGAAAAEEGRRLARHEAEYAGIEGELTALRASGRDDAEREQRAEAAAERADALAAAEEATLAAEERHRQAREAEARSRGPLAEAERAAQALETEARTLANLLGAMSGREFPPVVDAITVARGYEAALGAALGEDLDAPADEKAPAHWSLLPGVGADPALPDGVEPLASRVTAPPSLARRLAQIGIVDRAEGERLMALLEVGQRLVSREGDLWRWDGFVAAAEAPTPAARRLAEKNRLVDLEREAEAARAAVEIVRAEAARAAAGLREAAASEAEWRTRVRAARAASESARAALAEFEQKRAHTLTRLSAVEEAASRAKAARDESAERKAAAEQAMVALAPSEELTLALERARAAAQQMRAEFAEARAAAQNLSREAEARIARRAAIAVERNSWDERRARAEEQISEIAERRAGDAAEREQLAEAPQEFARRRRALADEFDRAEAARKEASDARVLGETALAEADRAARQALDAMAEAREARAASEARVEATRARLEELLRTIQTELDCEPAGLAALRQARGERPAARPRSGRAEARIPAPGARAARRGQPARRRGARRGRGEPRQARRRARRPDRSDQTAETGDRLAEPGGPRRLLVAFDVVNGHFKSLFSTLFEGGEAELQLVESDDPLEAGLELLARPPGKKPQTLTLLSGGEQALTALSLIFAVFLTNPSPICVLDEVDAPLDDYNVERFCDLLEEMRKRADTRFVTITHNPITMARMDRLFGVTMAERGVSQIVSVELAEAERLLEVG